MVVIVVIITLISISLPSVSVSSLSTQQFPVFQTYTSQYQVMYGQPASSTVLTGYSTATAWYPGNFLCDPASNACTPYPTPTATYVYPQSATTAYLTTLTSEATSTLTSEYTQFSTQTSYQNVPPYAVAGLTGVQYGVISLIIVAVLATSLVFLAIRSRASHPSPDQASKRESVDSIKTCQKCGAEIPEGGRFCTSCGSQVE